MRSNSARVHHPDPDTCPRCGEDRLIERDGEVRVCQVCAHDWRVVDGQVVPRR